MTLEFPYSVFNLTINAKYNKVYLSKILQHFQNNFKILDIMFLVFVIKKGDIHVICNFFDSIWYVSWVCF